MKKLLTSLLFLCSCTTDYWVRAIKNSEQDQETISDTPEIIVEEDTVIIENDYPDIEIEFLPSGDTAVKPGCNSSGSFLIKNIGLADLVIGSIDVYATIPTDIQVTSNYVPLPITLAPGSDHPVTFNVNQTDNVDDTMMMVVGSNDPDEPTAIANALYTSSPGSIVSEEFTVEQNTSADILMVVDNSCSMGEEQLELSNNAQLFIDELNLRSIDYRIAVITTDNPTFVGPVVTPLIVDPALELSNQFNVGTAGDPNERGILQASRALGPSGMATPGGSFLRSSARLSIVWISDEDDLSLGTTYSWSSDFWSKKSSPGDVSVWGIIGDPIYGCSTAVAGNLYFDLITAMGGSWTSICSTDWGSPMSSVAGAASVGSKFILSGAPIPTSIRAFVDSTESFDWVYVVSENAVSFNPGHVPAVGSTVTVTYTELGTCS